MRTVIVRNWSPGFLFNACENDLNDFFVRNLRLVSRTWSLCYSISGFVIRGWEGSAIGLPFSNSEQRGKHFLGSLWSRDSQHGFSSGFHYIPGYSRLFLLLPQLQCSAVVLVPQWIQITHIHDPPLLHMHASSITIAQIQCQCEEEKKHKNHNINIIHTIPFTFQHSYSSWNLIYMILISSGVSCFTIFPIFKSFSIHNLCLSNPHIHIQQTSITQHYVYRVCTAADWARSRCLFRLLQFRLNLISNKLSLPSELGYCAFYVLCCRLLMYLRIERIYVYVEHSQTLWLWNCALSRFYTIQLG